MKKNNNRGKAAIGAVLAAGMTASAITFGCGKTTQAAQSAPSQAQESNAGLTAADKVVIDGSEVQLADTDSIVPKKIRQNTAMPMYGVRQNPIKLMYGPRPNPRMRPVVPDDPNSATSIEPSVLELVANTFGLNQRSVRIDTKLNEDLKLSDSERQLLKKELERRFEVVIPDNQFNRLRTIADVINCICVNKY